MAVDNETLMKVYGTIAGVYAAGLILILVLACITCLDEPGREDYKGFQKLVAIAVIWPLALVAWIAKGVLIVIYEFFTGSG